MCAVSGEAGAQNYGDHDDECSAVTGQASWLVSDVIRVWHCLAIRSHRETGTPRLCLLSPEGGAGALPDADGRGPWLPTTRESSVC